MSDVEGGDDGGVVSGTSRAKGHTGGDEAFGDFGGDSGEEGGMSIDTVGRAVWTRSIFQAGGEEGKRRSRRGWGEGGRVEGCMTLRREKKCRPTSEHWIDWSTC